MRVLLGRWAGFCYGVRRAVSLALRAARRHKTVYTLGPLIHNRQAVEELRANGVEVAENLEELPPGAVVVLRSHGVERQVRQRLKEGGFCVVDATCPRVARIHGIVRNAAARGERVVIFGDPDHPEVKALRSEVADAAIITSPDDVEKLPFEERRICLVAQTTQDAAVYEEVAAALRQRFPSVRVHKTICDSTHRRQEELRSVLDDVDLVVVVGGRHSANTRRLAEIARASGKRTLHIETADELPQQVDAETVFVTAGASTPNWVIQGVMERLRGGVGLWRRVLFGVVRWNLTAAAAAAALTYAASCALKVASFPAVVIAALYVFCVHTFNQIIALRLEPLTRRQRHEVVRLALALLAGSAATVVAFHAGIYRFLLLLFALAGGFVYGLDVVPAPARLRSLRDLPGSKDIFCALGWAAVCTLLPAFSSSASTCVVVLTFFFIFIPVYIRSVLFDVRQMERDRFLGREAFPVVLGERSTVIVLVCASIVWVLLVVMMVVFGVVPPVVLVLVPLAAALIVALLRGGRLSRFGGLYLEASADAGLAAICLPFFFT